VKGVLAQIDADRCDVHCDGTCRFRRLTPAKYKVRISGPGVVTAESGEIDMTDSGPSITESVRVQRSEAPENTVSLATIDANVPSEARKEFEKASDRMEQKNWKDAKTHLERSR
jgi:hypothetical protein